MNVRRFTAADMSQALAMVKASLGEDAVILKTRRIKRGGLFSFLARELMEVTAASPDRKPLPATPPSDHAEPLRRGLEAHPALDELRTLREDLGELKSAMTQIAERVKYERLPSLPPRLAARFTTMVEAGLDDRLAADLAQDVNSCLPGEHLDNPELVDRELVARLSRRVPVRRMPKGGDTRARVIALVGPTGVGKTTTLAKLATSYRFWGRDATALVSADTYRVAALEQLKTFAAIAGLPMEAAYQPEALPKILARHRERRAIFIDTAGRSPADRARLDELATFLQAAQPDEVLLCLAVTTRLEDQLDVLERYRRLNPTGIVFTKLDESRGPGMIPNVLAHADLPAVCLTVGQSVPDDIVRADADRIAEAVVRGETWEALQRERFRPWVEAERQAPNADA